MCFQNKIVHWFFLGKFVSVFKSWIKKINLLLNLSTTPWVEVILFMFTQLQTSKKNTKMISLLKFKSSWKLTKTYPTLITNTPTETKLLTKNWNKFFYLKKIQN